MHKIDVEENLYQLVANEIRDGKISEGLRLKASVDANGEEEKARILYTKYRVEQLAGELADQAMVVEVERKENAKKEFKKLLLEHLPYIAILIFIVFVYFETS